MAPKKVHPAFRQVRNELLMDHIFFGSLVMHLTPVEDPTCALMWVDGRRVGFNPEKLTALLDEPRGLTMATGLLAQGLLKCCFEHQLRRGERKQDTWNEASDYVVNPIVLDSSLMLPQWSLLNEDYSGKRAEEVYELIKQPELDGDENNQQGSGTGAGQQALGQQPQPGQGQGTPTPGQSQASGPGNGQTDAPAHCEVRDLTDEEGDAASPSEISSNSAEWQVNMQQALNNANARGEMPGGLERTVQQLLEPKHDWKNELSRFAKSIAQDDYSWMKGNRRYLGRRMYLPSTRSERIKTVVLVVDTSGSIGRRQLEAWSGEINGILEDVKPERVIMLDVDAAVHRVREYTPEDFPVEFGGFSGGGGTDFRPAFQWVEDNDVDPDCLLYLTDLYGSFPTEAVDYPVLWGSVSPGMVAPFGETIYVEAY